ncbi:probable beta(1-3)glucanosyltransferases [Cephalotrichum gorgonifer]|uniref:1,3-beta-glucanosyltransferase n=1 Tax=Cephalotrichum gorgonifer TaxID=2041049 RepID=A0AAE8SRH1_9PEZI|nr:probable beta(1-3)glucanosyltransferases [Cephalotrichum gorgonifer]
MKTTTFLSALAASAIVSATPTKTDKQPPSKRATVPTVTASGNAFWTGKDRFYIRGIDYQPGGSSGETDPLADTTHCLRDVEKFKKLGVNTVRVYMVDNSQDHDECMTALADAGIYLVLDVNTPKYSINRADPYLSYNGAYLQNIFATIDMFAKYDNVLAFFSGNEVINEEPGTTVSAPYVKAVTRDMRNYIKARKYRQIPVGYSAADVAENRMQTAHYFNCGPDEVRSDFFAFNDYSWCTSDFVTSGWDKKVQNFTDYGLPIFLSEYGCIENTRDFGEIKALMSSDMTGVYSGGLMYEYTMEKNGYGIVQIKGETATELKPEFDNLSKAMKANPAPTGSGGASATSAAVECPTQDSVWEVDPDILPEIPAEAQAYMDKGAGTGVGFKGTGSQTAGDSGLSTSNSTSAASSSGSKGDDSAAGRSGISAVAVTGGALAATLFGAFLL